MPLDRLKQLDWIYDLQRIEQVGMTAIDGSSVYQRIC